MTEEERVRIVSEEYADLIVDYRYNPRVLEEFDNAIVHIMNEAYAVIHVPVPDYPWRIVKEYSYSIIPKTYGLTSEISLDASGVDELRAIPGFDLRGQGVLIGIVDTGIDYLNPVFLNENGTTKIVSIWDQTIQSEEGYPFDTYYGTEYVADQINLALLSEDPLAIVPSMDFVGHGTMMAGVAAGTENEEVEFVGVAPEAELVVVKLKQAKEYLREFYFIPEDVVCYQENDIMWGVQYCIQVARQLKRPIAICLGLGTSQTAHTGFSHLSSFLSILGDFNNVGIVTAVGNEGNLGRHYYGAIDPDIGYNTVELNVGEDEGSFHMELWGDFPGVYSIEIYTPGGEFIPRITTGLRVTREISFIFEQTIIYIDFQLVETLTGDQLILFRFENATPGIWQINVYGQGDLATGFHIWLPMGNFVSLDTNFIQPNIYTTIVAPGTSIIPITVTAYNPINDNLYVNASRGYTRSDDIKPELAAPGVNYIAPSLNNEFELYTGTGVAAAHTAGIVALFLEWAVVRGNDVGVDTVVIKKFLIRGARRREFLTYPNRDWGYGIIDLYNTFDILRGD
ncbi:S8 family peptidase [Mobilitalea sibirica]|uniref:S8 family peptidase n=1 Tax=Mobilitalea sibirica TaxID=1462919 RepID=A0A8J7H4R7_9FIRM|nr:S8 family peptidase [Mobilitalea sibirica]MBH1939631.1 S8 family peptidase [Mobilitalea sibirica]